MMQLAQKPRRGNLSALRSRNDKIILSDDEYPGIGLHTFERARGMLSQHRAEALRPYDLRTAGPREGLSYWRTEASFPPKYARRTELALFAFDVMLISFDLALLANFR